MKRLGVEVFLFAAMLFLAFSGRAYAQAPSGTGPSAASKSIPATFVRLGGGASKNAPLRQAVIAVPRSTEESEVSAGDPPISSGDALPLWTFTVRSPRDGHRHRGVMVGTNPFSSPGTATVPTQIIPLILRLNSVAVSFDVNTGIISTAQGHVTFDPTDADNNCLSEPNNVPLEILRQSPIFNSASFTFGSVNLGTTQYIDAFQRANFFQALGSNLASYHILFSPVTALRAVEINVPAVEGIAITDPNFLNTAPFNVPPFCAPLGLVDLAWLDLYLNDRIMPALAEQGVGPGTLPIFMMYNTAEPEPVNQIYSCCAGGYHSVGGVFPIQTYSVTDFDSTGVFGPNAGNTAIISHEAAEWTNDPYTFNVVPPWGNTGQVAGCADALEVGDPLTGTDIPTIEMQNGFAYSLQELAFFSWFFGGKSIGVNGWFSNNGTFTTDAGTPCVFQ